MMVFDALLTGLSRERVQLTMVSARVWLELGGFNRSSQHLHLEELQYGYTKTWSLSTWYPTRAWIDRPPTGGFEGRTASVLAGNRSRTFHRNICRDGWGVPCCWGALVQAWWWYARCEP